MLSDEERDRWREALKPMTEKYLETMKSEGVEDAAELYQKFQDKVAEYEAAKPAQ